MTKNFIFCGRNYVKVVADMLMSGSWLDAKVCISIIFELFVEEVFN